MAALLGLLGGGFHKGGGGFAKGGWWLLKGGLETGGKINDMA